MAYVFLPMLGLGLLGGANAASAHGFFPSKATPVEIATRQQAMFESQASLLGVSVDEIKAAWADGKSLSTLAAEKGVSEAALKEKMKAKRLTEMKTQLQTLVSQGVITQAQADKRSTFIQAGPEKGKRGHRGFGF